MSVYDIHGCSSLFGNFLHNKLVVIALFFFRHTYKANKAGSKVNTIITLSDITYIMCDFYFFLASYKHIVPATLKNPTSSTLIYIVIKKYRHFYMCKSVNHITITINDISSFRNHNFLAMNEMAFFLSYNHYFVFIFVRVLIFLSNEFRLQNG